MPIPGLATYQFVHYTKHVECWGFFTQLLHAFGNDVSISQKLCWFQHDFVQYIKCFVTIKDKLSTLKELGLATYKDLRKKWEISRNIFLLCKQCLTCNAASANKEAAKTCIPVLTKTMEGISEIQWVNNPRVKRYENSLYWKGKPFRTSFSKRQEPWGSGLVRTLGAHTSRHLTVLVI